MTHGLQMGNEIDPVNPENRALLDEAIEDFSKAQSAFAEIVFEVEHQVG